MMTLPELTYLVASILFILGLKRLSSPKTARSGNLFAALGMGMAVLGTFLLPGIQNFGLILLAIAIGTIPGWIAARKVAMTNMPQMVSLFNGMGGACALFISISEFLSAQSISTHSWGVSHSIPTLLGTSFGAISFTGSLIAYGKLQGLISEKTLKLPFQKTISIGLFLAFLGCAVFLVQTEPNNNIFFVLVTLSLILGIIQVLPIGGADMPVVISVLNSCTGMAAAVTGFAMENMSMIIAGTLVGAAGSFLTILMCRAMNRSLSNVLFGSFGLPSLIKGKFKKGDEQIMREIAAPEAAMLVGYARKVIIVPGYGLAVAQAQHLVHELEEILEKRGVEVKYAIHPVAGRMPGHMNVLLAEANVPYPKLVDMEEINAEFNQTDVALIIGANDVVNPAARTDSSSPIFGMPILDADHAKNIIVLKRGKGVGFAGIENNLFFDLKTRMLYGDAKSSLTELVSEIKVL